MNIQFGCGQCGAQYIVPDTVAGQWIRCPKCGGTIAVPAVPAQQVHGPNAAFPGMTPQYPGPLGLSPVRRRRKNLLQSPVVVASIGAVVVFAVIVILTVALGPRKEVASVVPAASGGSTGVSAVSAAATIHSAPATATAAPAIFGPPVRMPSSHSHVTWSEVRLSGAGQPGQSGRLWIYLPDGSHAPRSLPCVVIAPAGSILVAGMALGDGDQAEHYPYAEAGFAVVAYELDGPLSGAGDPAVGEVKQALEKFSAAGAGLVNARNALRYAKTQIPAVDPDRVFVAGHSSAATLALLVAEHEPDLKGCLAYAPCSDVRGHLARAVSVLGPAIPGLQEFAVQSSPDTHAAKLGCPLMLFHAMDDTNVPYGQSRAFADKLRQLGKDVTFESVPSGGHYDAMVREGLPRGIAWIRQKSGVPVAGGAIAADPSPLPGSPAPGPTGSSPMPTPMQPPLSRPGFAQQPSAPPSTVSSGLRGEVRLKILGYSGPGDPLDAARQAVRRIPWADSSAVSIDAGTQEVVIGVRVVNLNTGMAKAALQRAGFRIGGASFSPVRKGL